MIGTRSTADGFRALRPLQQLASMSAAGRTANTAHSSTPASHYTEGRKCARVDQWPMDEIDREVVAAIAELLGHSRGRRGDCRGSADVRRRPARPIIGISSTRGSSCSKTVNVRLTESVATGMEAIPILVERLRTTEVRRREVVALLGANTHRLERLKNWREIERRMRKDFAGWRSRLTGTVADGFAGGIQTTLTMPIVFTPCVERGYRAIRFEGRLGWRRSSAVW